MASIRRLPSGNFNVQIRRTGLAPISSTFTNKADALRWLRQTESEIERNVFVDDTESSSTTLGDALKRYLMEITPSKKGALKEGYQIRRLMKHPLSARTLASLKSSDFASYRDKRLQDAI
jgi:hypothetical protein